MPRRGYGPISVHDATKTAVEQAREEFDEYGSLDDVLRDAMLQLHDASEFLDDDVAKALEDGRRVVNPESADLIEKDDV